MSFEGDGNPQVLVRFQPGTSVDEAQRVLAVLRGWTSDAPDYVIGWSASAGIYVASSDCLSDDDRVELRALLDEAASPAISNVEGL